LIKQEKYIVSGKQLEVHLLDVAFTLPKNCSIANRASSVMSQLEHSVEHLSSNSYDMRRSASRFRKQHMKEALSSPVTLKNQARPLLPDASSISLAQPWRREGDDGVDVPWKGSE